MKRIVILMALGLLLLATLSMAAPAPRLSHEAVDVVDTRHKNLFVFKTDRKYLGATVEVYSMSGDLVTAQRLLRRKMIIDFCDVKFGEYTIRIEKDGRKQEFRYLKK
jgi:hypothetical protein